MSSNSLILRPTGELTTTQTAMLEELDREGNAGFDFQPMRIKFPTGGASGAFMLSDGDFLRAPVEMIVAVAQRKRAYWPSKKTLGQPPLCSAADGLSGFVDAGNVEQIKTAMQTTVRHPALNVLDAEQAVGPWDCSACPLAQWESAGDGGRGQACKATRMLLVIVKGWSMPAVLTLPPTSIKVWDTFASGLRQRGHAYFSRWLSVELTKQTNKDGTDYAVVGIKVGATLSDPEAAEVMQIRSMYADLVRRMDLTAEDYNTEDAQTSGSAGQDEEEEMPF